MDPKKPTTSLDKKEPKLERKPPIRKEHAPPLVRQTLTSSRRILKALNPLAKFVASKPELASTLTLSQSTILKQTENSSALRRTQSVKEKRPKNSFNQPQSSFNNFKRPQTDGAILKQTQDSSALRRTQSVKEKRPQLNFGFKKPQSTQIQSTTTGTVSKQTQNSSVLRRTQSVKETRPKSFNQPQTSANFKRPQIQKKSTSTDFNRKSTIAPKPGMEFKRQEQWKPQLPSLSSSKLALKQKQDEKILKRPPMNRKKSLSADDIEIKTNKPKLNEYQSIENLCEEEVHKLSPIGKEGANNKSLFFKTPSAYRRRSIYQHCTPSSNRKFSLIASTPAPDEMLRLQDRLNKWLKSRGKPPAEFHNLNKIVGSINNKNTNTTINEIDEQNKENIEVDDSTSESYENLKINTTPSEEEDISEIAKEAVVDLIKLVEQGYPTNESLQLLDLIKQKYKKIVDTPEYWELRACIDEAEGNIGNAVEHFSTAIIQGAKVMSVDKSLDLLLQKFSALNISPSELVNTTKKEIEQRVNARNVFKTRIILFSIRERDARKNQGIEGSQKKFIATPVRRSSRLSTSAYKNSSGLTLCRSLQKVDNAADISFTKNKALI